MAKKNKNNKKETPKPPRRYSLLKAIRGKKQGKIEGEGKLYNLDVIKRDARARKWVSENVDTSNSNKILPGTMIMFNYFTPKLQEELEYYDAMPCTIFFGSFKSSEGTRVIGWNLHYYPPKLRFQIMDKVFSIFRDHYTAIWGQGKPSIAAPSFSYSTLMAIFKSNHLDFGIREYIPSLMHNVRPIPPEAFQKAVFTEGRFMKQTRERILKYWKDQGRMAATLGKIK